MGCRCSKDIPTMNHSKKKSHSLTNNKSEGKNKDTVNKTGAQKNGNPDKQNMSRPENRNKTSRVAGQESKKGKVCHKQSNSEKGESSFELIPKCIVGYNKTDDWVDITIENEQGNAELTNEPVHASPNSTEIDGMQILTLTVSPRKDADDFVMINHEGSQEQAVPSTSCENSGLSISTSQDLLDDNFVIVTPEVSLYHKGGKGQEKIETTTHSARLGEKSSSREQKQKKLSATTKQNSKENGIKKVSPKNSVSITIEMKKFVPVSEDEGNVTSQLVKDLEIPGKNRPELQTTTIAKKFDENNKVNRNLGSNINKNGTGIVNKNVVGVGHGSYFPGGHLKEKPKRPVVPVQVASTETVLTGSSNQSNGCQQEEPGSAVTKTANPIVLTTPSGSGSCATSAAAATVAPAPETVNPSLKRSPNQHVLVKDELVIHPVPAYHLVDSISALPSISSCPLPGQQDASDKFTSGQNTDSEGFEDIYSASDSDVAKQRHLTLVKNIGEKYPILGYAEKEWKGSTSRANIIRKGYSRIYGELGYSQLRWIRGDNYCAIRAALFTALAKKIDILATTKMQDITEVPEWLLSESCSWVKDWTFARRLSYEHSGVYTIMKQCLTELQMHNAEARRIGSDDERELHFVDQFNGGGEETDIRLLEAIKLLMLFNATKLYKAYKREEEVPVFVWLLFARDTSADPESFMRNHLNAVGDAGGLEQIEMFLLGYTLGATIKVLRLSDVDREDFITHYPDDHIGEWPELTLVAEDDRHYNVAT